MIWHVHLGDEILYFFTSILGVKQGLPTLFCKFRVIAPKQRFMIVKSQNKDKHALCTIMTYLKPSKASTILGLTLPPIIDGKRVHYTLENIHNGGEIKSWVFKEFC